MADSGTGAGGDSSLAERFFKLKAQFELYKFIFIILACAQTIGGFTMFCFSAWFVVPGIDNLFRLVTTNETMARYDNMVTFMWFSSFFQIALGVIAFISIKALNRWLMGAQFVAVGAMGMVMLAQFAINIALLNAIQRDLEVELSRSFILYYHGDDAENLESLTWRHIQTDLRCCGMGENAEEDYYRFHFGILNDTGSLVKGTTFFREMEPAERIWPESCCVTEPNPKERKEEGTFEIDNDLYTEEWLHNCTTFPQGGKYRYKEGCLKKVEKFLSWEQAQNIAFIFLACMNQFGFSVVIFLMRFYTVRLRKCIAEGIPASMLSIHHKNNSSVPLEARASRTSVTDFSQDNLELIDLEDPFERGA